jgi:hypothetical protein
VLELPGPLPISAGGLLFLITVASPCLVRLLVPVRTHFRSLLSVDSGRGTLMLNQPLKPRRFGVDDKPRCLSCGELTFLTRRAPAAEHALEYERQTFTCPGCEREFERVVDARGKRVRSPALS